MKRKVHRGSKLGLSLFAHYLVVTNQSERVEHGLKFAWYMANCKHSQITV